MVQSTCRSPALLLVWRKPWSVGLRVSPHDALGATFLGSRDSCSLAAGNPRPSGGLTDSFPTSAFTPETTAALFHHFLQIWRAFRRGQSVEQPGAGALLRPKWLVLLSPAAGGAELLGEIPQKWLMAGNGRL